MVDFGGHPNVLHYEKSYLVYLQKSTSPDQNSCYTVAILSKAVFVCQQASLAICLPLFWPNLNRWLRRFRRRPEAVSFKGRSGPSTKPQHNMCIELHLFMPAASFVSSCFVLQARLNLKSSLHFTVHLFSDKCTVHLHIIQYCQLQDMWIDTKRLAVQGLQPPAPPLRPQEAFHGALFDVIYLTLQWELHLYFDALMRWPFFCLSLGALWCSGRRRSGQQFETGHEFGLETLEWWIKVRNNRCHRSRQICCSICSNRRCLSVYPVWM